MAPRKDSAAKAIDKLYANWQRFLDVTRSFAESEGNLFIYERERKTINGERVRLFAYRRALQDAANAGDRHAIKYFRVMQYAYLSYEDSAPGIVRLSWTVDPMALRLDPDAGKKLPNLLREDPLIARPMNEEHKIRHIARDIMIDIQQMSDGDGWVKPNRIFEKHQKDPGRVATDVEAAYDLLLEEKAIEETIREFPVPPEMANSGLDVLKEPFVRLLKPINSIDLTLPKEWLPDDLDAESQNDAINEARRHRIEKAAKEATEAAAKTESC